MSDGDPADERLLSVLERSQQLGFIGDPDLTAHVANALGFRRAAPRPVERALDLGSGGGLPGLVLAWTDQSTDWVLLDGSSTRTAFLTDAVAHLGMADRVEVVTGRAEDLGRRTGLRAAFDLVVARSFGPPAVVAECSAPFLATGGVLVVSEPPGPGGRWAHADELAVLGLEVATDDVDPARHRPGAGTYQVLRQRVPCPDRYPRRVGVPAKRPLF